MLVALRRNPAKRETHRVQMIPPPVKGLNRRDDITKLGPDEAWRLDNVIVTEDGVKLRRGRTQYATGIGAAVVSLMDYAGADGTNEFFAATETDIFDATAGGAVGAAAVSSLTNGEWVHVNFTNTAGSFLVICNGADDVRNYDGSSWTTPTITGVNSNTLWHVNVHMNRLWFCQKNSLDAWYLGTSAISGAATKLPLGAIFRRGGQLIAMGSWTRDGADGVDDLAVFITSRGEVAVYSGTDPASATTWELVGVTQLAEPIGRKCFQKVGSDLGILTKRGLLSLSAALGVAESNITRAAITDVIRSDISSLVGDSGTLNGWQVMEYPTDGLLIVNAVVSSGTYRQYVMNTGTRAWSRFTGLNGAAWCTSGGNLYYGTADGEVWQYTGEDDDGEAIDAIIGQGYGRFGDAHRTKHVKRIKPYVRGPQGYRPRVVMRFDYDDSEVTEAASPYATVGTAWDEGIWDVSPWGAAYVVGGEWQAASGCGAVMAPVILISSVESVAFHGCKIAFEVGDNL